MSRRSRQDIFYDDCFAQAFTPSQIDALTDQLMGLNQADRAVEKINNLGPNPTLSQMETVLRDQSDGVHLVPLLIEGPDQ